MGKVITPECIVKFPEYGDENITFTLCVDPKEHSQFVDNMDNAAKEVDVNAEFFRKDKKKNEEGELVESGLLSFKVKTKTEYGVKAFDLTGKPIEGEIGWGSTVKASIMLKPYEYLGKVGLSKYLQGFQVIDLRGGNSSAEGLGFETVKDEFTEKVEEFNGMF